MTVEEYKIGLLYSTIETCKNETGGGDGIEVVEYRPFENVPFVSGRYTSGQYTLKKYFVENKVPRLVRSLAPTGSLIYLEEAWNAYPYCKTVVTNPDYMKDKFSLSIESIHLSDRGTTENNIKPELDPKTFKSKKTDRGPLTGNWRETCQPFMCAYKLVRLDIGYWPQFQTFLEGMLSNAYPKIFTKFHREVFCWIDIWHGLTLEDVRKLEEQMKTELAKKRAEGKPTGSHFA